MQIEVEHGPAYAVANVHLAAGEAVKSEAGAMVAMGPGVEVETSTGGGLLKGLGRKVLGGESLFLSTYRAESQPGQVIFAPALPGDVVTRRLDGESVFVQSGSYLASATGIDIDTKWGGSKTFFSREGLFVLKASGSGELILSSYGAIRERSLDVGETFTVDTGHMVAWTEQVGYKVRKLAGWKTMLTSGEGFVVELTGPGTIYLQTRSADQFLDWLIPKLPTQHN